MTKTRGRPRKSKADEVVNTAVITAEDKKKDDFEPKQKDSKALYDYMKELKLRNELNSASTINKGLIPQKTQLQEMIEKELVQINELMCHAKQYNEALKNKGSFKGKGINGKEINSTPGTAVSIVTNSYLRLSALQNEYKEEDAYLLATKIASLKYRKLKQDVLSTISEEMVQVPTS